MRSRKVKSHKEEHHSLINYLIRTGIQPGSFAHFLKEYINEEPVKLKSTLAELLTAQLKAEAALIIYYLEH